MKTRQAEARLAYLIRMKLKCPICKQPVDSETNPEFPFCGERCRERDLGNWAMEKYKVAVPMMDESEPEETESDEQTRHEPSGDDQT
jgi:endogenous inhibitor of DNA gyrase (YacG/DUF329 family)